jgi:hypothetical protein
MVSTDKLHKLLPILILHTLQQPLLTKPNQFYTEKKKKKEISKITTLQYTPIKVQQWQHAN